MKSTSLIKTFIMSYFLICLAPLSMNATIDLPTPEWEFEVLGVNKKGNFMVTGKEHKVEHPMIEDEYIHYPKICFMVIQGEEKYIASSPHNLKEEKEFCQKIRPQDLDMLEEVKPFDSSEVDLKKLPEILRNQKILDAYEGYGFVLVQFLRFNSVLAENDVKTISFFAYKLSSE